MKTRLEQWIEERMARVPEGTPWAMAREIVASDLEAAYLVGRVEWFSARGDAPELPPASVPAGWGRPLAERLAEIEGVLASADRTDAKVLADVGRLIESIPGLIEEMDVEALAEVLEADMGAAALWGAAQSGGKGEVLTLAADRRLAGIEIAPLAEAVAKLDRRTPVAAKLSSAEWERVPLALRERAQFSARVESVRFLAEVQGKLHSRLTLERELLANGKRAFVDRSSFIGDMKRIAREENLDTTGGPGQLGTVRDIRSAKRLGLIYDMQTQQAAEFARWKMDLDPDVLDAYPAQRFVRIEDREKPRTDWPQRWAAAGATVGWAGALQGEMVALKTSPIWAALSRFGTPWPPFDYGSGMGLEDTGRAEAEQLGLVEPDGGNGLNTEDAEIAEAERERGFNDRLEASAAEVSAPGAQWLKDSFGDQVQWDRERQVFRWQGNILGDLWDEADGNRIQGVKAITLGQVPPRAARKASAAGVDLDGYEISVQASSVRHADLEHGLLEMRGDQRRVTRLDFEMTPHVLRDPDAVRRPEHARKGAVDPLEFEKNILGRTVVMTAKRQGKKLVVDLKTLWVKR